jgi:hypothetical protein
MQETVKPVFPIALCAAVAACGGSDASTTQTVPPASTAPISDQPSTAPSSVPATNGPGAAPSTVSPTATPAPVGTVLWRAGDSTLGDWTVADTDQCGAPVANGPTLSFHLARNGRNCGRNQLLPLDRSGGAFQLTDGATYTWTFRYVDGKPDGSGPGMGRDAGRHPEANLWQIHASAERDSPCTGLDFESGLYYPGSVGAGQQWAFSTCNGYKWFGAYTPGETDDWKIVARIANADVPSEIYGDTRLYRNGVLVMDDRGPNYHHSGARPRSSWWNFGIYKWRWELAGGGNSSMSTVNATFDDMTLTQQ